MSRGSSPGDNSSFIISSNVYTSVSNNLDNSVIFCFFNSSLNSSSVNRESIYAFLILSFLLFNFLSKH